MNYIKLVFVLRNHEDADILSAFLSELEVQGFEQSDTSLMVYFNEDLYDEEKVLQLVEPLQYEFISSVIPHENWNAQWESNFEPIKINHEVGVRANFHPPFTDCVYDIVITPKMSFGTGHHETTQMMLEYMSELDMHDKTVLDFGCGTGVLAIYASLKGAVHVVGIDNDEWSVENAKENCLNNKCTQIEISDKNLIAFDQQFDIILANINLNILLESFSNMKGLLNKNGIIILSGILKTDIPKMTKCFTDNGFRLVSQKQKKDWVALYIN